MARFASDIQVGQQLCIRLRAFCASIRSAKHSPGGLTADQIAARYSTIDPQLIRDILWYRVWLTIDQQLTETALMSEVFGQMSVDSLLPLAKAFGMNISGSDLRILKDHVLKRAG